MKEGSEEKGGDGIPKTWSGIRLLCGRHQVMEMFAGDFHRERGVTGEGTPGGLWPMHKAQARDRSSDNMGDCHRTPRSHFSWKRPSNISTNDAQMNPVVVSAFTSR